MNQNKKQTIVSVSTEHTNIKSRRAIFTHGIQNFLLVWLDGSIDEVNNKDSINTISKLREVVNAVHTFTTMDECINFINNIKEEKIFIISSGAFGQMTVPIIQDIPQVSVIYIFCGNKARHEQWVQQWTKVKGVFTDIKPICEALKQAAQECNQNTISMSFVPKNNDTTSKNLDQFDQSFIYTQLLNEILLTIDFNQQHFEEFITFCREQFASNPIELKNVDKLEQDYDKHVPIWWYTSEYFLNPMLNCALGLIEVDLIIRMGFFIRDLHKHITQLHSEQYARQTHSNPFTIYRGQGLTQTDFDKLMKIQGGLLSFNNFLSTSTNRQVSLDFVGKTIKNSDLVGILFVMNIDPSISSTSFANIRDVSYSQREDEILFSMHSIFRIGNIEQIENNNRLWQVDLVLTSDNDPQLYTLTETMQEETKGSMGWFRLGELMVKLGEYNKAEDLYKILLTQKINEDKTENIYYQLGLIKFYKGEYVDAIKFYEDSLKIREKSPISEHPDVANCYNDIGLVYDNMGKHSKALSSHEKALEIRQKTLPSNHPNLAISYNNIGRAYDKMGEYSNALLSHEKALKIKQKSLPENHSSLATSYNNIGLVYYNMGEYPKALSSYEKAHEIFEKALPSNHRNLATSYACQGSIYSKMGDYSKALSSYEKTLKIFQKTLHPNHPDLALSYNNIGSVYDSMDDYSKALSFYERALKIGQHSLLANHPDLQIYKKNVETERKKL